MRKIVVLLMCVAFILTGLNLLHAGDAAFPAIDGWKVKDKPAVYNPDNLYEYINGAADVFLSFDFKELTAGTIENDKKHSVTIDIYRHGDLRNGFGIYSQEKPGEGTFLPIGTQGYYEKGILNFLKGVYYVKISGFDLGDNDRKALEMIAGKVEKFLKSKTELPKAIQCFDAKDKIKNSEHYIAKDFLGHSFLHSAFVAEYKAGEEKYKVFLIETDKEAEIDEILKGYTAFLAKKGLKPETVAGKNILRFQDPYYRRSGKMNMKRKGRFLFGLFSKDDALAEKHIAAIEQKLIGFKLAE